MRFGCQIWVSKDEVKCVNDIGMLDLLEKSVENKKDFRKMRFFRLYLLAPP